MNPAPPSGSRIVFFCVLVPCVSVLTAVGSAAAARPQPAAITAGTSMSGAAWGERAAPGFVSPRSRGAVWASNVARLALRYLGRPYQWSGIGQAGFDCSGLVFHVFGALGIALPHSSDEQYLAGTEVAAPLLGPGDLVFFHTYTSGPSHVGIYLGAGRFIHASVARGVIVSSLDEPYYRSRYLGARRY